MLKKYQAVFALMVTVTDAANYPRVDEPCTNDAACFDNFEYCSVNEAPSYLSKGTCKHKDLFPLQLNEIFGFVLVLLVLLISNVGGLSGGGAVIPIAMVFFGFDTKQAIA